MKRVIFALGLPLLLAACGGATPVPAQRPPVVDGASVRLVSGFTVENVMFNGAEFTGPVVCDDAVTPLQFSFLYSGEVQEVDVVLEDSEGERSAHFSSSGFLDENDEDNLVIVALQSQAGGVLRSLSAASVSSQSMAVTSVPNPVINRAARFALVVRSSSGLTSEPFVTNFVPVVSNCRRV